MLVGRHRADIAPAVRQTLERRIRKWRAQHGPERDLPQTHARGRLGLSDFTDMSGLGLLIADAPLNHQLYENGFSGRDKIMSEYL